MNYFCSSTLVKELVHAELERHCALRNHLQLLLSGRYLDSVCTVPGCPTRSGHAPGIAHQALSHEVMQTVRLIERYIRLRGSSDPTFCRSAATTSLYFHAILSHQRMHRQSSVLTSTTDGSQKL